MSVVDFWETLASRMPRRLDYASLCERFAWDLPSHYNIGVDVFDRHAADKGKLAIIHDRGDGTAEKWTFWELSSASNRFANALRSLGVEREERDDDGAKLVRGDVGYGEPRRLREQHGHPVFALDA